nr:uncharacterized protein LOC111506529 isoform X1 [Leptinotarsa decemlineata]
MITNVVFLFLFCVLIQESNQTLQEDISKQLNKSNRAVQTLSRRRRYLTFPEGSSLQLVYCLTIPSVGVGEIFTFGATAALAWELPSEPEDLLLKHFKKTTTEPPTTPHHHYIEHDDTFFTDHHPSKRIDDSSNYFPDGWPDENKGFPGSVKSYYNPFLVKKLPVYGYSPAFTPGISQYKERKTANGKSSYYRENSSGFGNEPFPNYVHPVYHDIHRRTRRDLYGKIEKLFTALSKDGRACIMKAICEVSQVPEGKGTLMEEIMKAIFRIKPHEEYTDEDDYDRAANKNHDCNAQYPSCENSVWTNMF